MMLTAPPVVHHPTPWKLAIVTGRSQPDSCALSEVQLRLLGRLEDYLRREGHRVAPLAIIQRNFPFVDDASAVNKRPPGLWRASLANMRQYLDARTECYRQQAAPHWQALLDSSGQTNLIAGSCGLELLVRSIAVLRIEQPINVLALGPVANYRLVEQVQAQRMLQLHILCGGRDWIASRRFRTRAREDACRIASLGHLGYWANREVEAFACKWLFNNISKLQGVAVTCPLVK